MNSSTKDLKDLLSKDSSDSDNNDNNDSVECTEDTEQKIDMSYSSVELSKEEIDTLIDDITLNEDEINDDKDTTLESGPEVETKKESLFDKEWIKLEKGMKLNRINLFIKKQKEENELNDTQMKSLKAILFKACNDGMLNKTSDVTYKDEEIQSIRNLEFNEQTKKYKLKTSSSKHRVNVKSRSNIDRFMKK
jgi:hypothetical protein